MKDGMFLLCVMLAFCIPCANLSAETTSDKQPSEDKLVALLKDFQENLGGYEDKEFDEFLKNFKNAWSNFKLEKAQSHKELWAEIKTTMDDGWYDEHDDKKVYRDRLIDLIKKMFKESLIDYCQMKSRSLEDQKKAWIEKIDYLNTYCKDFKRARTNPKFKEIQDDIISNIRSQIANVESSLVLVYRKIFKTDKEKESFLERYCRKSIDNAELETLQEFEKLLKDQEEVFKRWCSAKPSARDLMVALETSRDIPEKMSAYWAGKSIHQIFDAWKAFQEDFPEVKELNPEIVADFFKEILNFELRGKSSQELVRHYQKLTAIPKNFEKTLQDAFQKIFAEQVDTELKGCKDVAECLAQWQELKKNVEGTIFQPQVQSFNTVAESLWAKEFHGSTVEMLDQRTALKKSLEAAGLSMTKAMKTTFSRKLNTQFEEDLKSKDCLETLNFWKIAMTKAREGKVSLQKKTNMIIQKLKDQVLTDMEGQSELELFSFWKKLHQECAANSIPFKDLEETFAACLKEKLPAVLKDDFDGQTTSQQLATWNQNALQFRTEPAFYAVYESCFRDFWLPQVKNELKDKSASDIWKLWTKDSYKTTDVFTDDVQKIVNAAVCSRIPLELTGKNSVPSLL